MTSRTETEDRAATASASPAIVIGVSDAAPDEDDAALELALAQARRRGVPVRVVHGCGLGTELTPETGWVETERLRAGQRVVGLVAHRLRRLSRYETTVETVCAPGSGVDALLAAAGSAALVVLQVRPRPAHEPAGPGSTLRVVASRASCPVVVVRGDRIGRPGAGIVVGVEEHGRAQAAVRTALQEAELAGVPVTAVHAWEVPMTVRTTGYVPPGEEELALARERAERTLAESVAGLAEDFPTVELHRRAVRGPVVDVLRDAAQEAGLLVVARHRSSRLAFHALGHAARALLHEAPCPLMVTPPASP